MTATLLVPDREALVDTTLAPVLARVHDRSMAEHEVALDPISDPDATFFQRWAAVRYLWDQFAERFLLEQRLLDELHPFIPVELRNRLEMQIDRLGRLQHDLDRLAHQRGVARELASTTRALLEALRQWYAEIEFAAGEIRRSDISNSAQGILEKLNRGSSSCWVSADCR